MQDWQVPLYIQAQSIMCSVEAMKVANKECELTNIPLKYTEKYFALYAKLLAKLVSTMKDYI